VVWIRTPGAQADAGVRSDTSLKLPAAGFRRAGIGVDANRGSITRGRSLAAIRWAAARRWRPSSSSSKECQSTDPIPSSSLRRTGAHTARVSSFAVRPPESEAWVGHFQRCWSQPLAEDQLLLFHNVLWFIAYGSAGQQWRTRRLSWDGIRVQSLEWLRTGDASGGSYAGPE
jgi:hypothetical protein